MRIAVILSFLLIISSTAFSQNQNPAADRTQKGRMYFYWGWNWGWYSKSNITFTGDDYDFELKNVSAKDRQTPFSFDPYFNPARFTIPQYNFRIGYFIKDNWDISFGIDHMKYVMQANQTVKISGEINNSQTPYDGQYSDDDITLTSDFLQFEHTDGLNYVNVELRRFDNIYAWKKVKFNLTEGFGLGGLYPKTNTTLLSQERYDQFHWSGFGLGAVVGINITFWDVFFFQTEFKGGYINMPGIRTTSSTADGAKQSFFYGQANILFGGIFNISRSSKVKKNK